MTMASLMETWSRRNSFQKLTAFANEKNPKFSMGMSEDYQAALEEAAIMCALGARFSVI